MLPQQHQIPGLEADPDATPLRVAKWSEVYETPESRKLKRLNWVSVPLSFNSTGYQDLMDKFEAQEAAALYGAWMTLCQIAATAPVRGDLATSRGEPFTLSRLSRLSHLPKPLFKQLIEWALSVGWLEPDVAGESPVTSGDSPDVSPDSDGKSSAYITGQNITKQNHPPPSPPGGEGGGGTSEDDSSDASPDDSPKSVTWADVESELTACDVELASDACQKARQHKMSPEQVIALVEHWRSHPGAWESGALYLRVKSKAKARLPPGEGWPKPSEKHKARQRDEAARKDCARRQAELDEAKAKAKESHLELVTLEKKFSGEIDATPLEELLTLVPAGPPQNMLRKNGWRSPIVRGSILRHFAGRGSPSD